MNLSRYASATSADEVEARVHHGLTPAELAMYRLNREAGVADQTGMERFEVPSGVTVEYLTRLVPGSRVRMTEGNKSPRNSHRGLSSLDLCGRLPYGLYSVEEVEACDAPVWVQGSAIGGVYLLDRRPVAYTCVRRPRWPNEGANESMGHWVLMSRAATPDDRL